MHRFANYPYIPLGSCEGLSVSVGSAMRSAAVAAHDAAPLRPLRFGTRGSALALAQTALVMDRLRAGQPDLAMERVVIRTAGDLDQTSPLTVIGGRGVFTTALQEALLRGQIDVAVHSAKDLPSETAPGLRLIAFLARTDPRDVFVSRHAVPLAELPPNPVIGTSSRRRAVQVRAIRPDARIVELRGNVDTRLRKAAETDLDGIVLAAAGVARMGWDDRVTEYLPLELMVPSPGQGALAVEIRADDAATAALLSGLDEPAVSLPVRVERAFLRALGAGCTTPVGAYAEPREVRLRLRAMLANDDGSRIERADVLLDQATAEADAAALAARLRAAVESAPPASASPLAGLTVLVTRPPEQAAALSEALRAAGAEPVAVPAIRIVDPPNPAPLDTALRRLAAGGYDWIVFTSGNTVERVLERLTALGQASAAFGGARVAAIGDATAARLREAGCRVDLVPERFVAEAMADGLIAQGVAGRRVLLPHADLARDLLPVALRAAGATVDAVVAYRTVPATAPDPALRARLARGEVGVVTFTSGSGVRGLLGLLGGDTAALRQATIACLGPVTAQAAMDAGLRVDVVADEATVPGLVTALIAYRRQRAVPVGSET